jgi:flagellin
VKAAINQLATDRSTVGANVSVLQSYSSQLGVLKDNLGAANSRIKDVDVAVESTQYARYNILVQSGTAMLAQANSLPQSALRLLG